MQGESESIGKASAPDATAPGAGHGPLAAGAVVLPPVVDARLRLEVPSLLLAALLHVVVIAALLTPQRGLGIGGIDMDAMGIEIVTMAPALEARSDARGRGASGSSAAVSAQDGDDVATPEETPAPDSRRQDQRAPPEAEPPPADIAVPDWVEQPRPTERAAIEPTIAAAKADGTEPDVADRLRPTQAEQPMSVVDSIPATELLARQQGGAAARGRETINIAAAAMAAARAGQRDEYKLAVFKAIHSRPPSGIRGLSGKVTLEFRVLPDGLIGEVRVVSSSGSPHLDEAAATAVRTARVPEPPSQLSGSELLFDIFFLFQ